jgi:hypothetical protein
MITRIGNWYSVELNDNVYNVLVQKETNKVTCDPSSILVFDEIMNKVNESEVWDVIQGLMERMDWKYDVLDEVEV